MELPEFTFSEVKKLVELHQLDWSDSEIKQLMSAVGGHPYLKFYSVRFAKLVEPLSTLWRRFP